MKRIQTTMRLAGALLLATTVAACATNGQTPDFTTQVQTVCTFAQPALTSAQAFKPSMNADQQNALDVATAAVNSVCANPQANATQATLTALQSALNSLAALEAEHVQSQSAKPGQ